MVRSWAPELIMMPSCPLHALAGRAQLEAAARDRIRALLAEAGAAATIFIDGAAPAKAIGCAAREFHADLLVITRHSGRHDRPNDEGFRVHNGQRIIRESRCPVISI